MSEGLDLAQIGALVGDAARANILSALLDGRALTASELAYFARVSPQTTSGHLAKLTQGKLLSVLQQGRNRYYRLAGPTVAQMLEGIMAVAAQEPKRQRALSKSEEAMRIARTCYDHVAGRLGVTLAERLGERGYLLLSEQGGALTESGEAFFHDFGVDLATAQQKRRIFCRPCLDWTERRLHLGGAVGAALATRCFDLAWLKRSRDNRALAITSEGQRGLAEVFGIAF